MKITGVISDLLGPSEQRILHALAHGQTERLADLSPRLKALRATFVEALRGRANEDHPFLRS